MSNLTEIRKAHERLKQLLDQEILDHKGEAAELRRFGLWLDTAFYLLAWANFENLTRKKAEAFISEGARSKGREAYAWAYLREGLKGFSVRKRLELVFHGRPKLLGSLNQQYDVRNDAAHDYRKLPAEVKDLPALIQTWEDLVDKF